MSRLGANGNGGYTNGYTPDWRQRRFDLSSEDESSRDPSRSRERRPGGYGGLGGSAAPPQEDTHVRRPANLDRAQAQRRSGDRWSNGSRSRSARRYGDGGKMIEEVLQDIRSDWSFMTDDNCVPIEVALKLLDNSTLGLASRDGEFTEASQQLQTALKTIVQDHHQGFNSSIGTFHKIQSSLQSSQGKVRELRDSLVVAKQNLSTTKPELKSLATSSQNYDDMLQILATIEQLQLVPEKLEARISEKRFLSAVEILQDALRLIRRSEMENIGALGDLRVYLSNQEHSLTDILIEELHSHLYLKSPYCEDRWKIFAQNKQTSAEGSADQLASGGRTLYQFLDKLDTSEAMADDAFRNPEADSFNYIRLIVESLNRMSRLEIAVEMIEQRLPVELFKVVDRSNNEVAQRHPTVLRAYANRTRNKNDRGMDNDEARRSLLTDLLFTLYARFEAIAEGHRVVHDVIAGVVKREAIREASGLTRGFKELWKLYQNEIRSLLHDYLSTDGDISFRSGQSSMRSANIFHRGPRDKNKRMFKLSDMDTKSSDLSSERDDLEFILKSSVPGLVSDSNRPSSISQNSNTTMHDGSATGHKLLVEPSVFNMGILLPPSLDFLNRLRDIVPPNADIVLSTLTSFLDDFLINVFQPQLDETLMDMCSQMFIEADAFSKDSQWAEQSQKPIFKGTARFDALVTAFCKTLDDLPHDQAFTQLIITQMMQYYDQCFGWYKALVTRVQVKANTGRRLKSSAALTDAAALRDTLEALHRSERTSSGELVKQEIDILIDLTNKDPLEDWDLISDRKNIAALCLLCTSMKWLASKIARLRHISDRATDSSRADHGKGRHGQRWTLYVQTGAQHSEIPNVYLPLNQETAVGFDGVVKSYNQLAITALDTLHLELRCHIIHSINKSLGEQYLISQPLHDPDPDIVALNADLVNFDEELSSRLPSPQHKFVTAGLGLLADTLLVVNASHIKNMNENGCGRMQLNILVFQQNLKNIEPEAVLSRCTSFYDMFVAGADAIVARARETGGKGLGFGYEELKCLIELCYSEQLNSERRDQSVMAKRKMDDHLLQLSEHMWQS